eukprot:6187525-Pleurochrysis_carterae.AAC.2
MAYAWSSGGRKSNVRCKTVASRRRRSATALPLAPSRAEVLRTGAAGLMALLAAGVEHEALPPR